MAIEKQLDNPPAGWKFYRLNVRSKTGRTSPEWYDSFFASVPDEMMATRKTGALATFEGTIYQSFNPQSTWSAPTTRIRCQRRSPQALDPRACSITAASTGHQHRTPFVCTWACYDGAGEWLTYDEYWCNQQDKTTFDHAVEVVARSCAWGWPEPDFFRRWTRAVRLPIDIISGRSEAAMQKMRRAFVDAVRRPLRNSAASPSAPGRQSWRTSAAECMASRSPTLAPGRDQHVQRVGNRDLRRQQRDLQGHRQHAGLAEGQPDDRPGTALHRQALRPPDRRDAQVPLGQKRPNMLWSTSLQKPAPLKKDDDCCDADRYCIYTVEVRNGLQPSSTTSSRDPEATGRTCSWTDQATAPAGG